MKNINNTTPIVVMLADLNNPARLDQLGTLLLGTFDRCFWAEDFSHVRLTNAEQLTVAYAHNVAHVATLTPTNRNRLKIAYDQVANRLDYRLSTDLREQISTKWNDLLEVECKVLQRGVVKGFTRLKENVVKPYIALPVNDSVTRPNQQTRLCPVTGLNIAHQKANTQFMSALTVRMLYQSDRPTFDLLAGRFLTAKQAGTNLDNQFHRIAENIRCRSYNQRNNPIRRLKKYVTVKEGHTLPMFPAVETVRPTDRQRAALEYRKGTRWELRLGQ